MFALFDDEQILDAYTRDVRRESKAEGIKEGIKEGRKEGMREGEWEKTKKIAFKLFKKNRPDDDIIDTLDISADELQKLKQEYGSAD